MSNIFSDLGSLYQEYFGWEPYHLVVEALCVISIVYLLLQRSYKEHRSPDELTPQEVDRLVAEWKPEPLVPRISEYASWRTETAPTLTTVPAGTTTILKDGEDSKDEIKVLNLASFNFLGLAQHEECQKAAINALKKYGCGSCGPRGFYGTADAHLQLETKIAQFMGTEESILYSSGFSTIASVIPAFSNRNDVLFCDKGVSFPVQTGILLSRSRALWFEHNDLKDLQKQLDLLTEEDKKEKRKRTSYRTYLVIEGVYPNYGDICPLPELLKLRDQHKFRIILDDSLGVGVLGKTGKGVCEHFGVNATTIDIITGSLGAALGSDGGFCAAMKKAVFHQRLNSLGYVFSASSPPFLVSSAVRAIELIEESKGQMQEKLKINVDAFRKKIVGGKLVVVGGESGVPLLHLKLPKAGERFGDEKTLQKIVDKVKEEGVLLTRSAYVNEEKFLPQPSIRVAVSAVHSVEELEKAAEAIKKVAAKVIG